MTHPGSAHSPFLPEKHGTESLLKSRHALVAGIVEGAAIFVAGRVAQAGANLRDGQATIRELDFLTEALSVPYREVQSALTAFPVSHSIEVT